MSQETYSLLLYTEKRKRARNLSFNFFVGMGEGRGESLMVESPRIFKALATTKCFGSVHS